MFEPIAIVGRACLLPGANSPAKLWQNVLEKKIALHPLSSQNWRLNDILIAQKKSQGVMSSDVGGIINDFDQLFNPEGFKIPPEEILPQDKMCQWLLHTCREALQDAGYTLDCNQQQRVGAIVGNLNYPTGQFSEYAEYTWLLQQAKHLIGNENYNEFLQQRPIPQSRFMSGYPMRLLARALNLSANTFALDAACASSLYAIKYACDQLQHDHADMMLAGGINATDNLFLHIGFTALQALSKSGLSRPLHHQADGLLPAHGAAIFTLKRLTDAVKDKNKILGVIRGIGLSNDGRSKGFLAPSLSGQIRAMQAAYAQAELPPSAVSWIECHATGTPLGDATEISSMQQIFNNHPITLGVLKSQIGHTITASGGAALINTLSAMQHKTMPPASPAAENPLTIVNDSSFKLLNEPKEWSVAKDSSRIAAINCFGFGGNNAHLLVEEWQAPKRLAKFKSKAIVQDEIAIVGIGSMVANATNTHKFSEALFHEKTLLTEYARNQIGGSIDEVELDVQQTRFSPNDLACALGQQLAIVKTTQEALANVNHINPERTAVLVGTQCATDIARTGLRWRLPHLLPHHETSWLQAARDQIHPPVQAAHVIGVMPNIVANRLNQLFNFQSPSFSIFDDETSGITALQLGMDALTNQTTDCVVVGAVDMCCESVHRTALAAYYGSDSTPGDAAVTLVLKRLQDAKRDQDVIYATVKMDKTEQPLQNELYLQANASLLTERFGLAFAATGLLHVSAAALACYERLLPTGITTPWLATSTRKALVNTKSQEHSVNVQVAEHATASRTTHLLPALPKIWLYSAADQGQLLQNLAANKTSCSDSLRLAIVAQDEAEAAAKRLTASQILQQGQSTFPEGIYYQEKMIKGDLAFVFTGATTSYANMEQDLLLRFPQLIDRLYQRVPSLPNIINIGKKLQAKKSINMFEELKIYSLLTQMHAQFTQHYLGLQPTACLGYCSGESNALVAMGAWQDVDQFYADIDESGIYTETLAGKFLVLDDKWNDKEKWSAWRLLIDVEKVKAEISNEAFVRLTIINSPKDCIIAGAPTACAAFINRIQATQAKAIEHTMIIHCPEFAAASDTWHRLHLRKTFNVPHMRFYSAGSGDWYQVNAKNAAKALLQQASTTVDFPRVIQKAWQDGIRIFVEHGPRDICTRWIHEILAGKDYLALSLDSVQRKSSQQIAATTARLLLAGAPLNQAVFTIYGNEICN